MRRDRFRRSTPFRHGFGDNLADESNPVRRRELQAEAHRARHSLCVTRLLPIHPTAPHQTAPHHTTPHHTSAQTLCESQSRSPVLATRARRAMSAHSARDPPASVRDPCPDLLSAIRPLRIPNPSSTAQCFPSPRPSSTCVRLQHRAHQILLRRERDPHRVVHREDRSRGMVRERRAIGTRPRD